MAVRGCTALLLLILCGLHSLAVASDTAFLVVHKKVELRKSKGVEKIEVSISLHNAGSSTAYDVSLNDDTWPAESFELVSGNPLQTWEKIDVGASQVHSFVLQSKVKGPFSSPPAIVKYRVAAKSALQQSYSTPVPELDILSDKQLDNRFDWLTKLAATYGPLLLVLSLVGLFVAVLVSPSKSKKSSKEKLSGLGESCGGQPGPGNR